MKPTTGSPPKATRAALRRLDGVAVDAKGRRPYLLNRLPHSSHSALLKKAGFSILRDLPFKDTSGIKRAALAACFSGLTDEDLVTSGVFIQAGKP